MFRRIRIIPFAVLFFLITLAPSFFSVMKGGNPFFFSDRYAYVSSFAFFLIVGSVLTSFFPVKAKVRNTIAIVAITILSFLTIHQSLLWGDSVKLFSRSVKLYPDFYLAHIDLGAAYKEEGRNEEALAELKKAVELYPLPNTFGVIGEIEAELGNFQAAIKSFKEGIEKHPEESELHYGLGQVYALMGESDKALEAYNKALELSESERTSFHSFSRRISSRRDMILMRIGILYGERGDHNKAMEYYRKAIDENPWNADAYFNLGVGLSEVGDIDGAIENFKKAVEFDPDLVEARVNLGILLMRTGQKQEAREQFEEVLRIDPGNKIARNGLGLFE